MRIALAVILSVHGLIHLLGFLKVWQIANVPQLTGATLFELPETIARLVGLIWLGVCVALIAAASMVLLRYGPWWLVAGCGPQSAHPMASGR